ncbi:MAG: colanic acid biosynthesis acetyltransferase WcaF [Pedobacter sp.]|nr:colanic acid biosynthesis acetyltransferase WcaF [Pedobacter sp.]
MTNNNLTTQLSKEFDTGNFKVGASCTKVICWYIVNIVFFRSGIMPLSNVLVWLLRIFGSTIGQDVRIKPHIQIKYPWKLTVGDYSWLGSCIIENLDQVTIGNHVCISQGAMLLTGNHNYNLQTFDLFTGQIILEDGVWICANSIICPGVTAESQSVLCVGSVANKSLKANCIYQGNPSQLVKKRKIIT